MIYSILCNCATRKKNKLITHDGYEVKIAELGRMAEYKKIHGSCESIVSTATEVLNFSRIFNSKSQNFDLENIILQKG